MSDSHDVSGLPAPDVGTSPVRRRPPNYFAVGERRRLMWRFMPAGIAVVLALGWIEQTWFPRSAPPATEKPIDTRRESVVGEPPGPDTVVIAPDPDPFDPGADALGAPAAFLAAVKDDSFFRQADTDAWLQILNTLRSRGQEKMLHTPARRVSFTEMFGQPRAFRGRAVKLRGTLHRLERVPAPQNHYGIVEYWQGWLEPEGGPAEPIVVHCLEVPPEMATGLSIREPVDVVGYFLKRHAYNAADTIRLAPLVVAYAPVRRPQPAAAVGASWMGTIALVTIATLIGATVVGFRLGGSPTAQSRDGGPVDLSVALAGHEPFSTAEALGRLDVENSAAERQGA